MTILQGTMQDGTVIPVQVDAQGRLVAEGLQGPAGPAGPEGPQGPSGGLPSGGINGDVLTWKDGIAIWAAPGTVPAPVPPKPKYADMCHTTVSADEHIKVFDGNTDTFGNYAGSYFRFDIPADERSYTGWSLLIGADGSFPPNELEVAALGSGFSSIDVRKFPCPIAKQWITVGGVGNMYIQAQMAPGIRIYAMSRDGTQLIDA